MESGSPVMVTVFWREVWPAVTSDLQPVMSWKSSATSRFALPSSGGAFTRTIILRRHSSKPSGPERLDLGETETSTSTAPPRTLQTSATFMPGGRSRANIYPAQTLSMEPLMAFR